MSIGWHLRRRYEGLVGHLPPDTVGLLDLLPGVRRSEWDEALNGQLERLRMVQEIAAALPFELVIETGTFRAGTTAFLARIFGCSVWTVEANERYFAYSRRRLRRLATVGCELGDSRPRLRALAGRESRDILVFAYLDAHWGADLPLAEELEIISGHWSRAVVVIDDFEVAGDSGYGFDDYGEDAVLSASYLAALPLAGWTLYYPAAPSAFETGAKRGCCVLSSSGVQLAIPSLRNAGRVGAAH